MLLEISHFDFFILNLGKFFITNYANWFFLKDYLVHPIYHFCEYDMLENINLIF